MSTELERLIVSIRGEVGDLRNELDAIRGRAGKTAGAMDTLKRAIIAVAGIQTVRAVVRTTMEFEKMEAILVGVTGSQAEARKEMDFLRKEADRLGVSLLTTANAYVKLRAAVKGTALESDVQRITSSVLTAARALGSTPDEINGIVRALEQMVSKGTVAAEELRGQLGERLVGAFRLAAEAMGKTTEQLNDMLQKGKITAEDLLPKLATALEKEFGASAEAASKGAAAGFARLGNQLADISNIVGEGFLDDVADSTNRLSVALQDEGFREGLESLGNALGNIVSLATDAAFAIGSFANKAIDLVQFAAGKDTMGMVNRLEELDLIIRKYERLAGKGDPIADFSLPLYRKERDEIVKELNKGAFKTTVTEGNVVTMPTPVAKTAPESEHVKAAKEALEDYIATAKDAEAANINLALNGVKSLEDALVDLMTGTQDVADAFKDMANAIIQDFARMQVQENITGPLAGLLNATVKSGQTGLGDILGNIFGGFRAGGGDVMQGKAYVVGEKRPELFVPNSSGRIVPNVGGMGGATNNIYVMPPPGHTGSQSSSRNSTGGEDIRITIDRVMGGLASDPGSMFSRALSRSGSLASR